MLYPRRRRAAPELPDLLATTTEEFARRYFETPEIARPTFAKHQVLLLSDYVQRYGMNPPDIQILMDEIAGGLEQVDNPREASDIRRQLLAFALEHVGDEDAATLGHMENLATDLYWMEQFDEANVLLEHVLEIRRRDLGARHPLTLDAQRYLATCLVRALHFEKGIELERDLHTYFREQYGDRDDRTIAAEKQLEVSHQWLEHHNFR